MNGPTPLAGELLSLAAAADLSPPARIAVPGCGYGHDAADLASRGFVVTGYDFAPLAIAGARSRYGDSVRWVEADWLVEPFDRYDAVFDHTCFVSFEPARRAAVVAAHAGRLGTGGLWLGAFFSAVTKVADPPFAIDPDEVRALAEGAFDVLHLAPATRSHPARAGREFLLVARRREG
jgi:SAM-dependent methyltransferase